MSLSIQKAIIPNDPVSIQQWLDNTTINSIEGMVAINCSFILILYT